MADLCQDIRKEYFLQGNDPLKNLLNAKPLIMSWSRSAFNEVNDWAQQKKNNEHVCNISNHWLAPACKIESIFFSNQPCMNGIILKFYNCRVVNLFWPTFWLTSRNICNWSAFIYFFSNQGFYRLFYNIFRCYMLGDKIAIFFS